MPLRLTFSLTLNALLLGLVLWLALPGSRSEARALAAHLLMNQEPHGERQPGPPPVEATATEVLEVNEPFHWAQLESADYRVYLANLRGIGCPESTVRDILIADVNELFSGRVKTLVDGVSGQFWHFITHQAEFEKLVDEKAKQLRTLDEERDKLLTLLFGNSNPHADEEARASAAANRERWERLTDFLPPEKSAQWVAAKDELERAWTDFLRTPGQTGAQQQAKRKELEAAHEQALREWLTTDEYAELRLRQSPAAGLRERLVGLALSEDQARAAARIQLATTDALAALSAQDPDCKARRAQLQQQSEAQTQDLIGPEAYAALQRATDHSYEPIYRVTQRLELPDAAAAQAYDIRRKAQEAARQLFDNKSLSAEDRQAMLQAIGTQTKESLSTTLGPKGFAAYDKIDGGWITQLTSGSP